MSPADSIEIQPLAKPLDATIAVPGSKSYTNRALLVAALAEGLPDEAWREVASGSLLSLIFIVRFRSPPFFAARASSTFFLYSSLCIVSPLISVSG